MTLSSHIHLSAMVLVVFTEFLAFNIGLKGGTSLVDHLCFFLSCVCIAFVRVSLFVPCGHLLGKG